MTAKTIALRNLLERMPKSLAAIRKLESWGEGVDLTDSKLLELAILLPRTNVQESLSRLKSATQYADGLPTAPEPVRTVQETIDSNPLGAVQNLRALRVEPEPGEPEPLSPWQAVIDMDPDRAPERLRAMALAGKPELTDRDLQARRSEPQPRENYKARKWA